MSRNPKIRITKNDRREYQRLVKNTRAKFNRVRRNFNDRTADELMSRSELQIPDLEEFKTRSQFNEFKENMERFTNRGVRDYQFVKNTRDVVASKRELTNIENATNEARRVAQEKVDEMKQKPYIDSKGKEVATIGERAKMMGDSEATGISVPPEFDFEKVATRERFEDKMRNMLERSDEEYYEDRKEIMQQNYLDLINSALNSEAQEFADYVENLSPDEFYQMYHMFDEMSFDLYDSGDDSTGATFIGGGKIDNHVNAIEQAKETYQNKYRNNDLDVIP